MYRLQDYQYDLPPELIAQAPAARRDLARLMVVERASGAISSKRVADLPGLLRPGDVLVVNDTRVVPARLRGRKDSGGSVEVLILAPTADSNPYCCLVKSSKSPREGSVIHFPAGMRARVCEPVSAGQARLLFLGEVDLLSYLEKAGEVPLPPYIRRNGNPAAVDDACSYQTVYAARPGAVAAPTAGLHFSAALLAEIRAMGVEVVPLTLHVGYGTFQPLREEDIRQHRLHAEFLEISPEAAASVCRAKAEGRRVVAVGTTTVRALEFAATEEGIRPARGWCDLYIYPGFRFRVIDAMLTNFHLPASSLLILVAAWAGRELILRAYAEAVRQRFRFYSYGDAMFIC